MEIVALILGIIAFVLSFIPGCGLILGGIPAVVGVILAIVSLAKKKEKKGKAIAGLILSILSVFIMIGMTTILGIGTYIFNSDSSSDVDFKHIDSSLNTIINSTSKYTQYNTSSNTTNSTTNTTTSNETIGEKNALAKAKSYLNVMAFSYSGLVKQLEYEGYSHAESVYGADNCGANWKEQAAKKAKSYINTMSFSRSGLIDQLEYEGFTSEQAEYGVTAVGY